MTKVEISSGSGVVENRWSVGSSMLKTGTSNGRFVVYITSGTRSMTRSEQSSHKE